MERVLIFGAMGYVGQYLRRQFAVHGNGIEQHPNRHNVDIADPNDVDICFKEKKPTVVINCVKPGGIGSCIQDPMRARRVIVVGTTILEAACERYGAYLIQMSSSEVFASGLSRRREITDNPDSPSVFGQLFAKAENVILGSRNNGAVLRSSLVYGSPRTVGHSSNFDEWILSEMRNGKTVHGYRDMWCNTTYVGDIFRSCCVMIANRRTGIHHVAGRVTYNRFAIVAKIADAAGISMQLVESAEMPNDPNLAQSSILDINQTERDLGLTFVNLPTGINLSNYR